VTTERKSIASNQNIDLSQSYSSPNIRSSTDMGRQSQKKPVISISDLNKLKDSVKAKMKHKYALNKSLLQSKQRFEQVKASYFYKNNNPNNVSNTSVSPNSYVNKQMKSKSLENTMAVNTNKYTSATTPKTASKYPVPSL
jgi:hypothetical protein